jgi:hypothetical protein
MATKNYILTGPIGDPSTMPYLLTKTRLVEGSCAAWDEREEVEPYHVPNIMTRAAVRKAMLGLKDFSFRYKRSTADVWTVETGNRTSVAIRFGCTTFKGENYKRLRKWALAK